METHEKPHNVANEIGQAGHLPAGFLTIAPGGVVDRRDGFRVEGVEQSIFVPEAGVESTDRESRLAGKRVDGESVERISIEKGGGRSEEPFERLAASFLLG